MRSSPAIALGLLARAQSEALLGKRERNRYIRQGLRAGPADEPRDEHGRWTDGGGSDEGSVGQAEPAGTGAGRGHAPELSGAYRRTSGGDAEGVRGPVAAVWSLSAEGRKQAEAAGVTPLTFHELNPKQGANQFHAAISAAKTGKYAAAVNVYPADAYKSMRLFTTPDGKAGFALKSDDIVSVFKHPDSDAKAFANSALALAVHEGGHRLDAFDTVLPEIYGRNGFTAVARLAWNDKYKPDDWSYSRFEKFNGGRPDVVFMIYDPASARPYRRGDGRYVADYDAGNSEQDRTLAKKKDFDPNEPRDEGGKWTDGGGGDPKLPPAPGTHGAAPGPIVVFHGTTETVIAQIKKEGLHVTPGSHHFDGDVYAGERGESVFVTTKKQTAIDYAMSHAQAQSWQEYKSIEPIVFKMEVPPAEWKKFHEDKLEPDSRYTKEIPPAWITGVYKIGAPGELVPMDKSAARAAAANAVVAYMVIFVQAPDSKKEFDESQHPRVPGVSPEGGQFESAGGGGGAGGSNYGLVPGDVAKFKELKSEWAKVNNELLASIDDPGGAESRAKIDQLEAIVQKMHGLHADPGGPGGIGLPGGPRDVVIVGGGPGGLAASINGAAEGLDTLVVEANVVAGGQAKFSSRIENFPGFPVGVTGERLTQNMYEQAKRLGAEAKLGIRVTGMTYDAKTGLKHITLSNDEHIDSRTVILAGGLEFRRIPFTGSEGKGVIVGDGKTLAKVAAGGTVCVIGGSNGAAQAALGCAQKSAHVYLLARSPIVESMSDYQIEALKNNPKITVIESDSISKLWRDEHGDPQILETAKGKKLPVKAVGIFAGSVPETKWVPADITRDKAGRIHTNTDLETAIPGVYAVGDMREGAIGRVGVAVGEGQLALRQANVFLDEQRKQATKPAAAKADKPTSTTMSTLITRLFVLDRDNPWFGQTVEGVKPLKKKKKVKTANKQSMEVMMPLRKPHKGESQSDFMAYCMHELGQSDTERPQDQKVAICMTAWKDSKKSARQLEPEDDESEDDFLNRCSDQDIDDDTCQLIWDNYKSVQDGIVRKTHAAPVEEMEFILSDESTDRMGDVIMSDGWSLDQFRKNPIALFSHRADFPIGKWMNLRVENKELRGRLKLAPEGTSPRIDEIRRLIEAKILQAVSVGFRPKRHEPLNAKLDPLDPFGGGSRFLQQELLECSVVSVPANANAIAIAKSLKISPATIDLVFAGKGSRDTTIRRSGLTGGKATTNYRRERKGAMSLAQRIQDLQTRITENRAALTTHLEDLDNDNVSDSEMETTNDLTNKIAQDRKLLASLVESERQLAVETGGTRLPAVVRAPKSTNGGSANGVVISEDELERRGQFFQASSGSKAPKPMDFLVRAGVVTYLSALFRRTPEDICRSYEPYNNDHTRQYIDWHMRAQANPALTTVTGWAAELVTQIQGDYMSLLTPTSIFPRLSASGLALSFGRAGRIAIPTRSTTPTIAGSFVGEGLPIPVRQGAFTAQILTPKKLAVITTWTKEIDEHSIPAIEGLLREAIQQDTAVALDSVLIDTNPATVIRPAGIFNGVTPLTATAGGGFTAFVGDIKALSTALINATKGNLRSPTWLMNIGNVNSASFIVAPNTGVFPWKAELAAGRLNNWPVIDSGTMPAGSVGLIDAADFVTVGGEGPRFEISDQATLHEEDTTPLPIVTGGTASSPVRSLWQTDTLALRMIQRLNWTIRRPGVVAVVNAVTW
jgi:HK97 family phage prohead protease